MKIQANNPEALAAKLETAGAINQGSAASCANHMAFANANVNGGRVWFGLATISQTANGWVAVINQNF